MLLDKAFLITVSQSVKAVYRVTAASEIEARQILVNTPGDSAHLVVAQDWEEPVVLCIRPARSEQQE